MAVAASCAQKQTQRVEAIQLPVSHHVIRPAACAEIRFLRDVQRVEGAGNVLPQAEHAPVQILFAGACGKHGISVFPGGAVKRGQIRIKRKRHMGVLCAGDVIDQIRQQRSGAGEKDVQRLHTISFGSQMDQT